MCLSAMCHSVSVEARKLVLQELVLSLKHLVLGIELRSEGDVIHAAILITYFLFQVWGADRGLGLTTEPQFQPIRKLFYFCPMD